MSARLDTRSSARASKDFNDALGAQGANIAKAGRRRPTRLAALAAFACVIGFLLGAAAPAGSSGQSDTVTVKYRVTSNEQVGAQRFITLVGTGHSPSLGELDADSSVVATPGPGCYPRTSDEEWSTATGTLEVRTEGQVCGERILGTWTIVGGTGEFSEVSGGGTFRGTLGDGVNVVAHYVGEVSN